MLSECFAELSWENTHLPEAPATDTGENAHPPVTLAQFLRGKNRPFTEASERRWPVSLLQLLQQAPRGGAAYTQRRTQSWGRKLRSRCWPAVPS